MNSAGPNKKLLYLVRRTPYGSLKASEFLDAMLVGAVFEQQVSLLFLEAGVWQLVSGQNTEGSGLKNIGQQLQVLPEYDVEAIFVCEESLKQANLQARDLCLPVTVLSISGQRELIAQQDVVFND